MTRPDVVELPDGGVELVWESQGFAFVVELDADEAIWLERRLRDGEPQQEGAAGAAGGDVAGEHQGALGLGAVGAGPKRISELLSDVAATLSPRGDAGSART